MRRIRGVSLSISLTFAERNTASRSVLMSGKFSTSVATKNSNRSVVVAGGEDPLDKSELLVRPRLARQHLGHLLALARWRGQELMQKGDAFRR
jgi:hypothetical protein